MALATMQGAPPEKGVWNPATIAAFVFLFSLLPAGVMAALNYGRLGRPDLKRLRMSHYILALLFLLVLGAMVAPHPRLDRLHSLFSLLLSLGYARQIYETQKSLYAAHLARGGKKVSLWGPVLLGIGFLVVTVVGFSVVSWVAEGGW